MKKLLSVILALALFLSLGVVSAHAEDITLDVIIAQYGPNTQAWTAPTSSRSLRKPTPASS